MKNSLHRIYLSLILFVILCSCNNDDDNTNNQILSGIYTESIPFSGNHQINFINNNSLILKTRNGTDQEFNYESNNNTIILDSTEDASQSWELEINLISNSKFEITNIFYVSIPENPNPVRFVTFEK